MKKMLVVIDYQNDFVDGALGFSGAALLDNGIAKKIEAAALAGDAIVVTRDTHTENYLETREGKALPLPHCIEGTKGWQLYGKTGEILGGLGAERVLYINKATFGVAPQDLADCVKRYAVDEIELVGLVTNMCVVSNACCFQAAYPHGQILVDADLCASFNPDLHEKTLAVLEGMQVKILHNKEV